MRRENPGDVWKCPEVKSPGVSKQLAVSSEQLPVIPQGDNVSLPVIGD
jgi:hypothetical protein